ncbi:MAG: hypothetical protein P0Y62_12885 [Candidatus Chryseobacterium colombiense]|nr:hypothetical protein [Chryseobacterium sp.]WEK68742.1 MAG: hypothetical protein P0Y62_12885 [Chryseobacterium sp.]
MIRFLRIVIFFLPIISGGLIYIIFRTEKLIMFRWFEYFSLSDGINLIKKLKNIYSFPSWFIYNLPDGLWIFSYTAISLEIWKHSITKQNIFWIFSIPLIAVLSEIFQLFKIIPGTFDFIDIIFYLSGIFLAYFISTIIIFNTKKHEKL